MTAEQLIVWGLKYVLGEAPIADSIAILRPMLTPMIAADIRGMIYPTGLVLRDERLGSDALGSFLRAGTGPFADAVTGLGISGWITDAKRHEMISGCLDAACAGGLRREWSLVYGMIGLGRMPAGLVPGLCVAVEAVGLAGIPEADLNLLPAVVRFVALQAALTGDVRLACAAEALLRRAAPVILAEAGNALGGEVEHVLRAAIALSLEGRPASRTWTGSGHTCCR